MLDDVDHRILDALREDARLSVEKVADRVGLSATPVRRRIKRLEERGVILGYRAVVDPEAAGYTLSIYVSIRLESRSRAVIDGFESAIRKLPEVQSCDLVTGSYDYLLMMQMFDIKHYDRYLHQVLSEIPGIAEIQTSVVISRIKAGATTA